MLKRCAFVLAVCASGASADDETVLHSFRSGVAAQYGDSWWGGNSGEAVEAAGDVNGDGHDDVIAGWPGASGFARVYSGADGAILHQFEGPTDEVGFGRAVAGAGDVDGDGRDDLLVASYGHVRVYSGRDGRILAHFTDAYAQFGGAVAAAGDIDGDGGGDVIVGAPGPTIGHPSNAPVRVYSVRTGALLHLLAPPDPYANFGGSVAGTQDFDGDGVPDIVVGADADNSAGSDAGAVYVFSGADASLIHALFGEVTSRLGASVDTVGDIDGDGVSEFLAGTLSCCSSSVYVRVWSGATGELIHHVASLARIVSGLGDVDGDGVPDFTSHFDVHSGATGEVLATFGGEIYDRPMRAAGDIDADGRPDVVRMDIGLGLTPTTVKVHGFAPVAGAGSITMHEQGCAPPSGPAGPALPTLQVTGTPADGELIALSLVGVPPAAQSFLITGTQSGNIPLNNGCSLLVAPPFVVTGVITSGVQWGFLSLRFRVPAGVASVLPVIQIQAFTVDPSLFLGYSLTNRVEVVFEAR